jgi:hypothetical protein
MTAFRPTGVTVPTGARPARRGAEQGADAAVPTTGGRPGVASGYDGGVPGDMIAERGALRDRGAPAAMAGVAGHATGGVHAGRGGDEREKAGPARRAGADSLKAGS